MVWVELGKLTAYVCGDYMSMIMFIFHFIKSWCDDCVCVSVSVYVLFAPHATQSHTTYVISSRNTRAKRGNYLQLVFFFWYFLSTILCVFWRICLALAFIFDFIIQSNALYDLW